MPRRGRSPSRLCAEERRVRCVDSLIESDQRDLVGVRVLLEEGADLLDGDAERPETRGAARARLAR